MAWGGRREGAGRKPGSGKKRAPNTKPNLPRTRLKPAAPTVPAEPKVEPMARAFDPAVIAEMLPVIEEISARYSRAPKRTRDNSPYKIAKHPKRAEPPNATMAMDTALVANNEYADAAWVGDGTSYAEEGLVFLGYPYLSEMAQRPEYRVMSETIADDATRKWIDFDVTGDEADQREAAARKVKDPLGELERMADPDERSKRVRKAGKADKIKRMKDDQDRLGVRDNFYNLIRDDGFFGRSHLFLGIGENSGEGDLESPIGDGRNNMSKAKCQVGGFKTMKTIEAVWTYPMAYNAVNPLKADWYNPQVWYVMGQQIHGTRLLPFISHPVPDMLKPAYSFGGLSMSQMAKPYVDIWLRTRQSVADIVHSFSVMVLSTDLSTLMAPGNAAALLARVAMFNMLRDNQGAFLINKNSEDFKNVSTSLAGLHELQAQSQEHMSTVCRIPLVKLTGISPSGLNATSEGEIDVYDDTISAFQNRNMRPKLEIVTNFQQLSLFGEIDPEITFNFEPLRSMTPEEKAEAQKHDAEQRQFYVDMGAISPGEVRQIIVADPELPYGGLDPDDIPEPPADDGGDDADSEGIKPGSEGDDAEPNNGESPV